MKRAQGMISGEELRAEDMLADLHNLRIQEVHSRDAARDAENDAASAAEELRKRLARIDVEREGILQKAEEEMAAEVESFRVELQAMRKKMQSISPAETSSLFKEVTSELDAIDTSVNQPSSLIADLPYKKQSVEDNVIYTGDSVKVSSLGMEGTVISVDGKQVEVSIGALRTRVDLGDVVLIHHASPPEVTPQGVHVRLKAASPGIQIDLRGQTVADTLDRLDRYLDEASLASLPWVRIIHGKGTGKLRREVRRYINNHPLVTSYEAASDKEGGEGVTIAHLVNVS